jgi:hypothetical protein
MTRAQVQDFLQSGAKLLGNEFGFGCGRISEFNSNQAREMPYVWVEEVQDSPEFINSIPFNNWDVTIHIAQLDTQDSIETQYEPIVNFCDEVGQKLGKYYNLVVANSKLVTISNIGRRPFRKKHAQCLTGVILTFNLNMPDRSGDCLPSVEQSNVILQENGGFIALE